MPHQPLVSRPGYGGGDISAESKLPGGGPSDKGLPLDDGLSGYKTFAKPVDDTSTGDQKGKDESIWKVESPRDLPKSRDRIDVNDKSDSNTSFNGLGDSEGTGKSKYPYRDGIPNAHNASIAFVLHQYLLTQKQDLPLVRNSKVAVTLDGILQGLNPKFMSRAKKCSVVLKRADIPRLRWIFSVDCGNGPKLVRMKALTAPKGPKNVKFTSLDLWVACSCPAWRWLGPEFHSTTKDYQDPNTPLQGTASPPDIKDPERQNNVCKHVAAVMLFTRDWTIPRKKG